MNLSLIVEKSALISTSYRGGQGGFTGRGRGARFNNSDRDQLKCEHCGGRSRDTKDSVGTSMDAPMTYLHVSFIEVGLAVVEEVVALEATDLVLTQ